MIISSSAAVSVYHFHFRRVNSHISRLVASILLAIVRLLLIPSNVPYLSYRKKATIYSILISGGFYDLYSYRRARTDDDDNGAIMIQL
jgi:membrane protein YdbS with pleckstrin-like domain